MSETNRTAEEHLPGTPAWWEARYLDRETPWDTGIVPPEGVSLIESGTNRAGWALDLG